MSNQALEAAPLRNHGRMRTRPALATFALVFGGLHIFLALLMREFNEIATIHALGALLVGVAIAVSGRQVVHVAYLGAYITGAEVLWRMTEAQVFHEYGKYAAALLFIVAMLRRGRLKGPALPFLYFLLLLPSSILTAELLGLDESRQQISFNLSGPFAILVCTWFFSHLTLTRDHILRLLLFLISPIIGIGTLALTSTIGASSIYFTSESNYITSGGFGPNQVSAVLGLGALLAFFCYTLVARRGNQPFRLLMIVTLITLATQSALTFSRCGLLLAASGAAVAIFYLFRDRPSRLQLVGAAVIMLIVANFFLLPRLDTFTGGALTARFQDFDSTGRDELVQIDFRIWEENPVFGVGPGMSVPYRAIYFRAAASHTEFTRLLAEHGFFGLIALILLLVAGVRCLIRKQTLRGRAVATSMLCWGFLFMLVNAMRLVAPAFAFGLGFARLLPEEEEPPRIVSNTR